MNDAHQPRDVESINRQALEELAWAIEMSQGQFTLLLARSNYEKLRDEMAAQLQELCPVPIRSVWLDESVTTLYSALREELGDEQPDAVMVFGLEAIAHLEQLLASTNQVRDEFRQAFPFPLVLWVNDDVLTKLIRLAPDFHSWSTTTEFAIAPFALCEALRSAAERIFTTLLTTESNASFVRLLRGLDLTILQRQELSFALNELQQQHYPLEPEVQASLDFFRGVSASIAPEALTFLHHSLAVWRSSPGSEPLKTAMTLYFIGRYYFYTAEQEKDRSPTWELAKAPLEEAIALLEQENRPDLLGKAALQLARVLDRLQAWDELNALIKKVLPLHQTYGNLGRLAQDYRYLAETALHHDRLTEAKAFAEQAIATLDQVPEDARWKGLYLLTQARIERKAGNGEGAIELLQTAYDLGDNGFPRLYVAIIEELRSLHLEQKQYLEAFQLKQRRLSIEQQFGIRAFVGAGRLNPTREDEEKRLLEIRDRATQEEDVPPEIRASGRQKDLNTLLERIGRSDYQLIVVHGYSGVGKSSLVTAGLAPALRGKTSLPRPVPVLMRRYVNWVTELALQLGIALHQEDQSAQWNSPDAILQQLRQHEQHNRRPVLIFDQFEEFFFAYPDVLERRSFFDFLGRCLQEVLSAKVILSLREDYLYYLLELNRLTTFEQRGIDILSRNVLYPLGNFAPNDAKAIIQDLTDRAKFYLEPDLIEALVTDLSGELGEVRPIELQVVGAQLQDDNIRSLDHYRQYGDNAKEVLVQRYLDQSIDDCGSENSQLARLVLYLLTDEKGTRPLKTRSEIERDLLALLSDSPQSIDGLDLILTVFVGSGLVLLLPEQPADRYQLVHDYIAEFIRQQQAPQLQRLIQELAEERKQRQLTEAELAKANEAQKVLAVANQKAKRRLLISSTLLAASLIAAVVAIPAAIRASNELGKTRQEADRIQTESQQREQSATARIQQADQELETANQQVRAANERVLTANEAATVAEQRRQLAETRRKAANERIQQAEQAVENARARLAQIDRRSRQELRAAEAGLRSAQAQEDQAQQAQAEAERQAQEAAQLLDQRLRELNALTSDLNQARSQLEFIQNDLSSSIAEALTSIERQTGVRSAVLYINFIPTGSGNRDEDRLAIWVITARGQSRATVPDATRASVMGAARQLRVSVSDPRRITSTSYLPAAQQLHSWFIRGIEQQIKEQNISNLVFLMEPSLRSLPLAALHDGNQFLIEKYSLGLMPGLTLTDTRYVDIKNAKVLALGITDFSVIEPDLNPLPSISDELSAIQSVRQTRPLLNNQATLENLLTLRQQENYQIVHLSTHTDFRAGDSDSPFIRLWDARLTLDRLNRLNLYNPPVELLVMSSDSTGLGSDNFRFGMAGAAIQAGVRSVLASLGYMSNSAYLALMPEFYRRLRTAPIKAEALREAQIAMLRGEIHPPDDETQSLQHPYYWAGFVMIGNPW